MNVVTSGELIAACAQTVDTQILDFEETKRMIHFWLSCFSYFGFEIRWIYLISWIKQVLHG